MKIESLVTNVRPVRSPARGNSAITILGIISVANSPIQATFVVSEPLCDAGTPLITLLTAR